MKDISIFNPKTKLDKQIQTTLIVVLIAVALWYVWQIFLKDKRWRTFNFANPFANQSSNDGSDTSNGSGGSSGSGSQGSSSQLNSWTNKSCTDQTRLEKWVVCNKVKELQDFYNARVATTWAGSSIASDGYFGDETADAVEAVTGKRYTTLDQFKYLVNLNPLFS